MAFQIDFKGLDQYKELLSTTKVRKNFAKAFTPLTLNYHRALQFEIKKRYTFPDQLDTVLVQKTGSQVKFTGDVIETGLTYRYKPVSLVKFKHTETIVPAKAAYLHKFADFTGKSGYKKVNKNYAIRTEVQVLRESTGKIPKKFGQKGFYLKGKGKVRTAIVIRKQRATWNGLFVRAPIGILFGLSLSQAAAYIFNKRPDLLVITTNNIIQEAITSTFGAGATQQ
ncbi:MAG: hypothetical protein ACREVA_02265 [Burkholderiales bacterium]